MKRLIGAVLFIAVAVFGVTAYKASTAQLPNGKFITPVGMHTTIGSFPSNMVLSPDGRFAVVSDAGTKELLTVMDTKTGAVTYQSEVAGPDGLYYGLAFKGTTLFVSHGVKNRVTIHDLGSDGKLVYLGAVDIPSPPDGSPDYVAGLAVSEDGKTLYAVLNESYAQKNFKGGVAVIDIASKKFIKTLDTPGFPYGIACANGKVYVSSEMDNCVAVLDPSGANPTKLIPVGAEPTGVTLTKDRKTLYVANSSSDTISAIDTDADKVAKELLLRPAAARGLPGCTPLGVTLSPDEKRLYAPMGDWNSVAVVDVPEWKVSGFVPVGWYPTSAVVTADKLLVANARGDSARNPNGARPRGIQSYILTVMQGSVSSIDLSMVNEKLGALTDQTLTNNRVAEIENSGKDFKNPGIEYVIYIIKENRTYDQVMGDVPGADGDPNLCLFGKDVTPNQHALVDRFGIYDNFFACAEVSATGWQWSTAGMANEYTSRNTDTVYGDRGRNFDFDGVVNGSPVDLEGKNDVTRAPGGYIWDQCLKARVSFRNYGCYVAGGDSDDKNEKGEPVVRVNEPFKKALQGHTCIDFYQFDEAFADSSAWVAYGLTPPKSQLKTYGSHQDACRFDTWKREYDGYVQKGDMPMFMMLRLMRDHTVGTRAGWSSPKAMVADNDYSVGQLVDAVSHSPYWNRTAIFVVEDDAQAGQDHVDAHRTFPLVISPFSLKKVDHQFYNTDSVLRTIELLLGLDPMNQYDAIATPFSFEKAIVNGDPFKATLPERNLIAEVNVKTAYRSRDSGLLVNRFHEDDVADTALNDILWHSIKGANVPMPKTPGLITR